MGRPPSSRRDMQCGPDAQNLALGADGSGSICRGGTSMWCRCSQHPAGAELDEHWRECELVTQAAARAWYFYEAPDIGAETIYGAPHLCHLHETVARKACAAHRNIE